VTVVGRGGAGQPGGVFGRQEIGLLPRLVFDDGRGRHDRQPFAHVSLREVGLGRKLSDRAGRNPRQGVEQASAVTHGGHQYQGRVVECAHHLADEGLGFAFVKFGKVLAHRGCSSHIVSPIAGCRARLIRSLVTALRGLKLPLLCFRLFFFDGAAGLL
jgi:hypothetical protein